MGQGARRGTRQGGCRGDRRGDAGFTLVEVAVAAALLLVVLTGVGSLLGTELVNAGATGAEGTASGLLTQAMEQIRALPFQLVVDGLSSSDSTIATDPKISVTGTAPNQTYTFKPTGETIPVVSPYTQAPLDPHLSKTVIDGVSYSVGAYPTIDPELSGVYRMTVIVSWAPAHGVSSITAQTLVYSPSAGCLTDTNHPFAAPCQPFFYSQAGVTSGSGITVSGTVLGLSFTQLMLYGPQASSSLQMEESTSVLGRVKTSEGDLALLGTPVAVGGNTANTSADNDPGTRSAVAQSTNTASQSQAQPLSVGSLLSTGLSVIPGLSDQGTSTSTVTANATTPCKDLAGTAQLTNAACSSGTVTQSGQAASLSGALSAIALPLASWSASSVSTFSADYPSAGFSYCATTNGDGCVHAAAQRTIGTVEFGGLPGLAGLTLPVGWGLGNALAGCPIGNYFAALVGYSDKVTAESGINSAAPTASSSGAPKLCYWNGSGYSATSVSLGSSPQALSIPPLSVGVPALSAVTITPSLSFGTVTTTQSGQAGCSAACTAVSEMTSPVTGSLQIQVVVLGVTIANLALSIDLGTLQARTSYQAAP
ncbi:MAG: prepilin-type N-terminal cleavage/methylation domain-containing protein [Acidimicrobiales bacterium]